MAFGDVYERQVRLLVRVMPYVTEEDIFALKGGTAINLFVRDLPRLSVDIDLAYLPVQDRETSLRAIDAGLKRIAGKIMKGVAGARVVPGNERPEGTIDKLTVAADGVQIKIEVTPVLRGTVFEPVMRDVSPKVEDRFGFAEARMVSLPDLYGGKIMAALDRQHPRDLFDVRDLLANEGITDELRQAFLVYLISHGRPMAEVLRPTRKNLADEYAKSFEGMTEEPVALDELIAAREQLIEGITGGMPEAHRRFLIGFKRGEPDWDLLGVPHARDLPGVRWKQQNLDKLDEKRRAALIGALAAVLGE